MTLMHRSLPYLLSLTALAAAFLVFDHHHQARAALQEAPAIVVFDSVADQAQSAAEPVIAASQVQSWQLFGQAMAQDPFIPDINEELQADASTAGQEEITESGLNLDLLGVFAPQDDQKGHAIISEGAAGEHYQVGDTITDGVILKAIHADRVTIDNRGKREFLLLPELNRSNSPSTATNNLRQRFERKVAADRSRRR